MFKINFYTLFFLCSLFVNNPNVLCFSFSQLNDSSLPPTQSQQSFFPDIFPQGGNNDSTALLFPTSNATPEPDQWHFNSSTHTFIPPLMLSGWGHNMSTDTFNINTFSLPIAHENENCNDIFANTNNSNSLFIPHGSILSNTADTSADKNDNSTLPVAPHTNQDKDKKLSKHKKPTKTYTCPTCHKNLKSQSSLNYHLKTHDPNREKPYQCKLCDKSFVKKSILKEHIKRKHNKEKPFKCDFCSRSFATRQEKFVHHRTHTGEKPYKCHFCNKCFAIQATLQYHIRGHTGEKPYKCSLCDKCFSRPDTLQNHIRTHTGKKRFKCNICGKGISSKNALKAHLNNHEGKKPHKCTQCPKAYASHSGLKHHLKMHNTPKPYTCHDCGATFSHKKKYENHILYEEEKNEDCKCHICKKVYSDKYNLKQHNKRVHPRK